MWNQTKCMWQGKGVEVGALQTHSSSRNVLALDVANKTLSWQFPWKIKQKLIEQGLGQGVPQTSFNHHIENIKSLFTSFSWLKVCLINKEHSKSTGLGTALCLVSKSQEPTGTAPVCLSLNPSSWFHLSLAMTHSVNRSLENDWEKRNSN